ncbi:MAG: tetratricopeptide repeat protein [Bacteroidales bacterium]|nr:tetratricopeptide repeat protein [Bacteroidales bacterium]
MADNKKHQPTENEQNVGQTVSSIETFLKENGNKISYVVIAILVIVAACLLFNRYVSAPKIQEALGQSFTAEQYFAQGDFEKALNGDGNALGLLDVIDEYGKKAGAIVYFEAGVCQLQLKNYNEAINYLNKYKGKDNIISGRAQCCLGDAYVGLGDFNKAISCYEKAIKVNGDNILSAQYLFKAGLVAEEMGQTEKALGYYDQIQVKYPQSPEAVDIDKYIYRVKNSK